MSKLLSDKYVNLRKLNRQSRLSVAPAIFDWVGPRALVGPVFEPRNAQNSSLNARFELLADADIHGFYHSVYTHTIAWAIHGRDVAKRRRADYSLYGNLIDLLVRNRQDGQTIGIPVGPDTSRLIAEVLGSAIDRAIQKSIKIKKGKSPSQRSGMRFVDDYTFGCTSRQEAERIIAAVRLAVNSYELELNNTKTGIHASVPFMGVAWREHVRSYLPQSGSCDQAALNRYFYNVHMVAESNPENDVIKYALKAATSAFVDAEQHVWTIIQNYLLSAYRQSATALSAIVDVLIFRQMAKKDVETNVVEDFVNARIPVLADLQKNGEIVWLLFLAICLELRLRQPTVSRLLKIEDGAIAVLVADARRLGLVQGTVNFALWNSSLTQEGLRSPMWLYSYETTLKGLNGTSSEAHITADLYFKELYSRKIEFYRSGTAHMNASDTLRASRLESLRRK